MRKPFIIANWKMNKNVHESVAFVKAIKEKLPANKEIGIAAQAVSLYNMKKWRIFQLTNYYCSKCIC